MDCNSGDIDDLGNSLLEKKKKQGSVLDEVNMEICDGG